jgi:hypothetical protein
MNILKILYITSISPSTYCDTDKECNHIPDKGRVLIPPFYKFKMFPCSTEEREEFLNFVMGASSSLDNDMHNVPTKMAENKAQKNTQAGSSNIFVSTLKFRNGDKNKKSLSTCFIFLTLALCLAENEQQTNNHWKNLLIQLHDFSKSK